MRNSILITFSMVCAFSAFFSAFAQKIEKKIKFSRIESKAKLSNPNITAILQGSKGFLWVGTDDGLNRFDGYDFKVYRNIEKDTNSLLKNKIQCIFEDSRGKLWISTLNSGLHHYNRQLDAFVRIPEFSQLHCQVYRITEDKNHNVWIGGVLNSSAFISKYDAHSDSWKTTTLFPGTDPVYCIVSQGNDELWLGTRLNGLFKWNEKSNTLTSYKHDPSNPNSLPGNYIQDIIPDSDYLWIATRSGLCKFNPEKNTFKNFAASSNKEKPGLLVNTILSLCKDQNDLWIGTENGGLSRLNKSTETFNNFQYDKNNTNSIPNNSIWNVYKDRQGRIWIGSYAKGLCVLDKIGIKFSEINLPLENDLVNAVMEDSRGRLWVGTEEGLLLFDKSKTYHFKHDEKDPKSLRTNAVNCLYEDSKGQIWTGNWNGGLNRFDENSKSFIHYLSNSEAEGELNPNVFSITESKVTHELLVCTFGGLLILKDQDKGIFEINASGNHEGDQLLLTAFEDSKNNLWVGSYSGLSLFDQKTKKYKKVFVTNDTTEVSDRVNCILEDHKGRLWVGSHAGLHQMISQDKFISYTTRDGLPVNVIQGILEDSNGNLWIGTTDGLVFFNPETKTFKTYDESDGLLTKDFRKKAFCKTQSGKLIVGGKGLNIFDAESLSTNENKPAVYLTDLKIFNQSVRPSKNGVLKNSITDTKEIYLTSKQTFFSIHYVGINFTSSDKNKYAYKLEGFDNDWNQVGDLRFATFTNLNPGTYTFKVKASNNDNLWNEDGASLIIHVLPPWWKTLWFRTTTIAVFALLITFLYYYRVNQVEKRNTELQTLVNIRTRELQSTNKELGLREFEIKKQNIELIKQQEELAAQNEELVQGQEEVSAQRDLLAEQNTKLEEASRIIALKNEETLEHNQNLEIEVEKRTKELLAHNNQLEQFAFISAHNLRAPVARILGLGQVLKLPGTTPADEELILEKLLLTTQELDRVVRDLNKILDIRKNNSSVISEINLKDEITLVKINLQKEIEDTEAEIIEDFSDAEIFYSVKPYIDSILMNLVSNAIKYRHPDRKPVIHISAQRIENKVCLSISDNGLGIDLTKYEDKLFKLYSRFHSHVEGKGMGLYLVKTQVAALGGSIEASGEVYKGINFKIYLPVKMEEVVIA